MCFSEGANEGGRPALSVRSEEAASRGAGGGAKGPQRPASLPLSEPFSLSQENQCKRSETAHALFSAARFIRVQQDQSGEGHVSLRIYSLSLERLRLHVKSKQVL